MELIEGKDLIIGRGEVGNAIFNVLKETYDIEAWDVKDGPFLKGQKFPVRYLHIAIPFTKRSRFIRTVNNYINKFNPRITVIHSTVGIGTTERLTVSAVHSPVIGVHRKSEDPEDRPSMEKCLRTFNKWVAGKGSIEIANYFENAGIPASAFNDPKITEAGKILDTTRYGLNIAFAQEQARLCRKLGIPYETTVMGWEENYNQGYEALGMGHVRRPVLTPGKIGGHCVMPNIEILLKTKVPVYKNPREKKPFEWLFLEDIKKSNYLRTRNEHLYE